MMSQSIEQVVLVIFSIDIDRIKAVETFFERKNNRIFVNYASFYQKYGVFQEKHLIYYFILCLILQVNIWLPSFSVRFCKE